MTEYSKGKHVFTKKGGSQEFPFFSRKKKEMSIIACNSEKVKFRSKGQFDPLIFGVK